MTKRYISEERARLRELHISTTIEGMEDPELAKLVEGFMREAYNGNKELADILRRIVRSARKPKPGCDMCKAPAKVTS